MTSEPPQNRPPGPYEEPPGGERRDPPPGAPHPPPVSAPYPPPAPGAHAPATSGTYPPPGPYPPPAPGPYPPPGAAASPSSGPPPPPGPYPPPAPGPYPPVLRDPYEATVRDPFEATSRDPYHAQAPDPLEATVPDPAGRRRPRRRRAIEAVALVVLVTGLGVVRWIDDGDQATAFQPREHVTVVRRGATGALGHVRFRLLGRDATAAPASTTTPAGAAHIALVLEARPLDAKGVKELQGLAYMLRDRAGHMWSGAPDGPDPVAGTPARVTVSSDVPRRLVNSVLLEVRPGLFAARGHSIDVLLFAH